MKTFKQPQYINNMGRGKVPNKNKIRLMKKRIENLMCAIGVVLLVLSIWKPQYAPLYHAWGMLEQGYGAVKLLVVAIGWIMERVRAGK